MPKATPKTPKLESALEEISKIIDKMEQGDLTLEQSLAHFERGIKLIKHSQKILTQAEQKVHILMQENKQKVIQAYNDHSDTSGDAS